MGYKALINKSIDMAFNQLKDLAEPVTFIKKEKVTFNFADSKSKVVDEAAVIIKAVIIDINKKSATHNPVNKLLIFKTKDVDDITLYDKISIGNVNWKFAPNIKSDGYLTLANIFREN